MTYAPPVLSAQVGGNLYPVDDSSSSGGSPSGEGSGGGGSGHGVSNGGMVSTRAFQCDQIFVPRIVERWADSARLCDDYRPVRPSITHTECERCCTFLGWCSRWGPIRFCVARGKVFS